MHGVYAMMYISFMGERSTESLCHLTKVTQLVSHRGEMQTIICHTPHLVLSITITTVFFKNVLLVVVFQALQILHCVRSK